MLFPKGLKKGDVFQDGSRTLAIKDVLEDGNYIVSQHIETKKDKPTEPAAQTTTKTANGRGGGKKANKDQKSQPEAGEPTEPAAQTE